MLEGGTYLASSRDFPPFLGEARERPSLCSLIESALPRGKVSPRTKDPEQQALNSAVKYFLLEATNPFGFACPPFIMA